MNHLLKVLGLVVSHSVFSPFHSLLDFFFTSVNDQTGCPAIQGFDRTKPIFDWTLSVDRPLFQALPLSIRRQLVQIIGRNRFSTRFEILCWIFRVSPRTRMSQNQAKSNY